MIREQQFVRLFEAYADQVERGILPFAAQPPPRPKSCTDIGTWRAWVLSHPEATDLTNAARSRDRHDKAAATMDAVERRRLYEQHFKAHVDARVPVEFTSAKRLLQVLQSVTTAPYSRRKTAWRIVSCNHCWSKSFTTANGHHSCEGVKTAMAAAGQASKNGRTKDPKFGVHSLLVDGTVIALRNEELGFESWLRAAVDAELGHNLVGSERMVALARWDEDCQDEGLESLVGYGR